MATRPSVVLKSTCIKNLIVMNIASSEAQWYTVDLALGESTRMPTI